MNQLQIFRNDEFGAVRTIFIDNQLYFVGKDVAESLGYTNPSKALIDHVDEEDKLNNESLLSLGQRGGWLINESGLYSLILSSRLPNAKKFKRWVTGEVLPSIRRTGAYSPSADHSEKVAYLQALRTRLREWQDLEKEFSQLAANDRKRYEKNRSNRDKCRIEISKFENLIDAAIQNLDNSTPNKAS